MNTKAIVSTFLCAQDPPWLVSLIQHTLLWLSPFKLHFYSWGILYVNFDFDCIITMIANKYLYVSYILYIIILGNSLHIVIDCHSYVIFLLLSLLSLLSWHEYCTLYTVQYTILLSLINQSFSLPAAFSGGNQGLITGSRCTHCVPYFYCLFQDIFFS